MASLHLHRAIVESFHLDDGFARSGAHDWYDFRGEFRGRAAEQIPWRIAPTYASRAGTG